MPNLIKMRGQPSSYDQRVSRYEILPFWDLFAPFWAQKWDFHRGTGTKIFFGDKQYPNDVKKSYLTFIAICSRSNAVFTGLITRGGLY